MWHLKHQTFKLIHWGWWADVHFQILLHSLQYQSHGPGHDLSTRRQEIYQSVYFLYTTTAQNPLWSISQKQDDCHGQPACSVPLLTLSGLLKWWSALSQPWIDYSFTSVDTQAPSLMPPFHGFITNHFTPICSSGMTVMHQERCRD